MTRNRKNVPVKFAKYFERIHLARQALRKATDKLRKVRTT